MEGEFFIRIEEPGKLRKNFLETSKEIIQNLKSYHKILKLREEKLALLDDLKTDLKEINLLFDKIKELLPLELLKQIHEEKPKTEKKKPTTKAKNDKKVETKIKPQEKASKPSELAKLEESLKEIEDKLRTLG
ncbi:MAG: hypothetical protein ABIC91_05075 [Nanoarchaeota archaeon]|nr:hypothetical protein [Nanoarchaeota archaeon]MBU1031189.1 hypothetical protein [Nanoarchaeota archaeon]MBU1850349.1 hypothetical protein [Nanoarchaeota archaeon]